MAVVNEVCCPHVCQIETSKLRSRCHPDNSWLAKVELESAIGILAKCKDGGEEWDAGERDMAVLGETKASVEAMLKSRIESYYDRWKAKGRKPSTEDEWYEIEETIDDGGRWEALEAIEGSRWPFKPGETVPDGVVLLLGLQRPQSQPQKGKAQQQPGQMKASEAVRATDSAVKGGTEKAGQSA